MYAYVPLAEQQLSMLQSGAVYAAPAEDFGSELYAADAEGYLKVGGADSSVNTMVDEDGYEMPIAVQVLGGGTTAPTAAGNALYAVPFEASPQNPARSTSSSSSNTDYAANPIYAVPFEDGTLRRVRSSSNQAGASNTNRTFMLDEGGYVDDAFICGSGGQASPDYAEPNYATPAEDAFGGEVGGQNAAGSSSV